MEFSILKCTMLIMRSGKRQISEGIVFQIKKESERSEKRKITSTWKYWKRIHSNKGKSKKNIAKEYFRGTSKLLDTKLCSRHIINGINTWAAPV